MKIVEAVAVPALFCVFLCAAVLRLVSTPAGLGAPRLAGAAQAQSASAPSAPALQSADQPSTAVD
jgi:hypothetical protein